MLDILASTWKITQRLGRPSDVPPGGLPRFEEGTTPLWGHGKALLDDPAGLLEVARAWLGPVFSLQLPKTTLTVVAGEAGRALASRPHSLTEPRYLLSAPPAGTAEARWWTLPTPTEDDRRAAKDVITRARCRAPIERAAQALAGQIERWPRRGDLLPLLEGSLPLVLGATLSAPGRAHAAAATLAKIAIERCEPDLFSPWPTLPWQRLSAGRLYPQLASELRPLATDRRHTRREAPSLLGALSAELGPQRAARVGAWIAGVTWHRTLAELRATLARPIDDDALEELLEEHDLLHGDQGDVTFESATRALALNRHLESALDGVVDAPQSWQLTQLESDLRLQRSQLRAGQWLLSAFGGRGSMACSARWLDTRWGRPLIQALWSVLLRELCLDHEGGLRYRRR